MTQEKGPDDDTVVGSRGPEAGVAAFLLAIGALVVADSLRVGTGWGDDGPRSGYFPFYIGLMLMASSGFVLLRQLLTWSAPGPEFARRSQLASVLAVFVPMVVYVALIAGIGIYVASLLLIGYFMRRHGGYRWGPVAAVSVGVPLVVFLVFERWFLVLLPKGPLEHLFGL
jgi:hypothetical protein